MAAHLRGNPPVWNVRHSCGTIGMAHVPYEKWLKFVIPFTVILSVFAAIFLVAATMLGWS